MKKCAMFHHLERSTIYISHLHYIALQSKICKFFLSKRHFIEASKLKGSYQYSLFREGTFMSQEQYLKRKWGFGHLQHYL